MALRGTLTHRKTRRLAARLNVDQCAALGYLEALWHVTAEQQVDGGIGRMEDQDIADEMFYSGDAAELVEAFVLAGWIDRVAECRLYVHDWHEHADDSVKNKLARAGQRFANGDAPNMRRLSKDEREKYARKYTEADAEQIHAHAMRTRAHKSAPPVPVPEPVPVPVPDLSAKEFLEQGRKIHAIPAAETGITERRFTAAWNRHYKQHNRETKNMVCQLLLSKDLDWDELERRHIAYCEYWAKKGWNFCPLTFLQWLENGMLPPPEERARDQPKELSQKPFTDKYAHLEAET